MKLSVIIVNYNVKYYLAHCLRSLEKASEGIETEVIVVDNASTDGSENYITRNFPKVQYIYCRENLGFSKANNLGAQKASGQYLLILNPDTMLTESTLQSALQWLDTHPDIGALGTCMLQANGQRALESRRGLPTPLTAFYKMVGLCKLFPKHPRYNHYYMGHLPWHKPVPIDVVSGAFCMLSSDVYEQVGGFDEDYFIYGEDVDLSYRLLQSGRTNWYIPARILHYKGASTRKVSVRYVWRFYHAMLVFSRKHFKHFGDLLRLLVSLGIVGAAIVDVLRMPLRLIKTIQPATKMNYIFFVSPEHVEACQTLVKRHNLHAQIMEVAADVVNNEGDLTYGNFSRGTCVVYDAKAYRFEDMLNFMEKMSTHHFTLGVYYDDLKLVITHKNIIV